MPASPSTAKAVKTASKEEYDTAELAIFRQEWLKELHRRKAELPGTVTTSTGTSRTTAISAGSTQQSQSPLSATKYLTGQISKENESSLEATSFREVVPKHRNLATHPALNKDGRIAPSFQIPKALESALNIYRQAVAHEQRGELDQAIHLYRQAFHLVCGCVFANSVQSCLRYI